MRFLSRFITGLLLSASLFSVQVRANDYADTIELFKAAGESSNFFNTAYGFAVFPTIAKAAIAIGGAYGKGRVYAGGKHIGNTEMSQLSLGLSLGGQGFSQIVFFEDERAFREFAGGNFEFGAQASAVVITAAANAQASTQGASAGASGGKKDASTVSDGYYKGMAVFTIVKGGLMYEMSVSGQTFSYDAL